MGSPPPPALTTVKTPPPLLATLTVTALGGLGAIGCENARTDRSPPTPPGLGDDIREYAACGCGCCGGSGPSEHKPPVCVSSAAELRAVIAADRATKRNADCGSVGCEGGTLYRICDPAAPPPRPDSR
ncbi:MAG: hypothetical protein IPQ07_20200 [Myxococcales bacterium]|nr:hypothetical protein [Myxococcales bacterium]